MSDFFANGLSRKVDALMDRMYGAGVSSHQTIIEQLNYLLFLRELSRRDQEMKSLGIKDDDKIVFDGKLGQYSWDNLLMLNPEALFSALEECYREIPNSTKNSTVRLLFRNAHLKLYDKPTLRLLVHELDEFAKELEKFSKAGQKDIFGDMYEYLLSKLSQAGTSGQFRTPRHIIEFIVSVLNLSKGETILDPACGTAGFLVKAYEHLAQKYTSKKYIEAGSFSFDKLSAKEKTFLFEHTFTGFDSDEDMIKFGLMNLYLHGLEKAKLTRQNTLTDTSGTREKWDVILANPPFAGKIDKESVSEDIQMGTGATEILFLRYMLDRLTPNGRMGVIIPEGVLFKNDGASKKMRQMLLEQGLWCVTSLPAGVFNPYAGVKTSIVFLDKTLAEKVDNVVFVKIENDGFSLSAQRQPIEQNDLPAALDVIEKYKDAIHDERSFSDEVKDEGESVSQTEKPKVTAKIVSKHNIADSGDYNLSGERYAEHYIAHVHPVKLKLAVNPVTATAKVADWPMVELGDDRYFRIESGGTPSSKNKDYWGGDIAWATLEDLPAQYFITDINSTARTITESGLDYSSAKLLPPQSVLVSSRATIGRIATNSIPVSTNQGFKNLIITNPDAVDYRYVAYVLKGKVDEMKAAASGGTYLEISKKNFAKIKIPLPPLEVQNEIVAEIDRYQRIIDGARQVIENWEPKIEVDPKWEMVELGEIFDRITKTINPQEDELHGVDKCIGLEHIESGTGRLIADTWTPLSKIKSAKTVFETSDILYGRLRPNLNKVYLSTFDGICSTDFIVLRAKSDEIMPPLYAYILRSKEFNNEVLKHISGAQLPRIKATTMQHLKVPLIPLNAQEELAEDTQQEEKSIMENRKLIERTKRKIDQALEKI